MVNGPLQRLDRQMDLAEIIGGAGLHRFDGDVLGPTARQHDDWCLDAFAAYIAQQREAVSRAEHVVEERHVVRGSLHRIERLFVGRRDVHLRAAPRLAQTQEFHHHLGVLAGIVDDEDTNAKHHRLKIPAILPPSVRKNPSMARLACCLSDPLWMGHSSDGTLSPSLKYSV